MICLIALRFPQTRIFTASHISCVVIMRSSIHPILQLEEDEDNNKADKAKLPFDGGPKRTSSTGIQDLDWYATRDFKGT